MMRRGWHTIHARLFVLFLFCMLVLLLISSFLYYQRTTEQYHTKIGEIARKNMTQTMEFYDLLLRSYDSMTKSVSNNFDLQRLLSEKATDAAVRAINDRTITNILATIFYSREDALGIHVMSNDGAIYSYENYVGLAAINDKYAQSDWYRQIRESSGEMVWLGVHNGSLIDPTMKRPVFSFGRQLYDLLEHRPIGAVLVEVDAKSILSGLENLRLGEHSEVYVTGSGGRLMASTTGAAAPQDALLTAASLREGKASVDMQPHRLVVLAKPETADWSIVSLTPDADLNVEQQQTKRFLLIVGAVMVVLAIALATFVSLTISSPLKRLISEMRQVERGNFHGVLKVKSYEEINILVASFNQMVRRMDDLIERVKLSSISEKNAQLQALQSQVNPHFLYNTLDMIYWMLDEKENDRLGKVVLSLSHMFRYSSSWEDDEVTLREELGQVRHYLTVIENRLEGRFAAELAIEEPWLHIRVPKMTLQPIIENAVKHGLEPLQDRFGVLRVYTRTAGDGLLELVIADNGVGMEPAVLRPLQLALEEASREQPAAGQRLPGSERPQPAAGQPLREAGRLQPADQAAKARRGIGLHNLQRRLVYRFGSGCGMRVESRAGEGTTVVVTLPLAASAAAAAAEPQHASGAHGAPGGGAA